MSLLPTNSRARFDELETFTDNFRLKSLDTNISEQDWLRDSPKMYAVSKFASESIHLIALQSKPMLAYILYFIFLKTFHFKLKRRFIWESVPHMSFKFQFLHQHFLLNCNELICDDGVGVS